MRKSLTIVAPAYNEELIIREFCSKVLEVLEPLKDRYDACILVVIDKGTDRTFEIVTAIGEKDPRVKAILMSSRFGHQSALLAGIDYSDTDLVITMDCDLQHPPELLPRLLQEYERGADIVYTVKAEYAGTTWWRRVASRSFYRILNYLSHVPIKPNSSDYRLMTKRVADVFRTQVRERTLFLRGLLSWIGFPSATIEFDVPSRGAGTSKYNMKAMGRLALYGILSFSKRPLRIATAIGFAFSFLGVLYGTVIILDYVIWRDKLPPGWATLAVISSIFAGIQLLCLGVIGEYVGAIFNEVKGRPHYIVDRKYNV